MSWTKCSWAAILALSITVALGERVAGQSRPETMLAAPQVTIQAGDTMATLAWPPVKGAEGYRVFRSDAGEQASLVGSTFTTELVAVGLDNGRSYRFQVAAYAGGEQGAFSAPATVVPMAPAMERPAAAAPTQEMSSGTALPVYQEAARSTAATPVPVEGQIAPAVAIAAPPIVVETVPAAPVAQAQPAAREAPATTAAELSAPAAAISIQPTVSARAGNRSVTLTWDAVADATSYRIFRTTSGTFSTSPLTTTTNTSYTNTGLTNGTTYTYTVAARNASGDGPRAAPVSAAPLAPPTPPTGLSATAGDKQVNLSWSIVTDATGYNVYRGTAANSQTLLTGGVGAPPFLDASVENGPTYFYKVTAINGGGESARSTEASASPTGPPAGLDVTTLSAHRLLRQATWGPRPGDVDVVKTMGAEAFVDAQLAAARSDYPDTLLTMSSDNVQQHFANLALNAADQLRLRVAFALHKIWVVSGVEVNNSTALVNYQRVLLNHAFGNFRGLMNDMTLNPAMGRYLNMLNSRSEQLTGAPANENYARELMQLFTLGIPTLRPDGMPYHADGGSEIPSYSEADVKELARILTGWTFGDGNPATVPTRAGSTNYGVPMEAVTAYHDARAKFFLGMSFSAGQSARADLEQALDLLFQHPNLGPFISRQLIKQLVTSNPSPGYVWAVASVFNDNGQGVRGDLAAVVRAILLHPLANQDGPDPGKLSEPFLFAVSQLRALNATVTNYRFLVDWAANMGQRVLFPPSVFSYFSPGFRVRGAIGSDGPLVGPEFQGLTTVTAQTRVNFVASLLAGSFASSATIDYTPFTARATDPAVLVDYCSEVLMGTRMPIEMRNEIVTAVRATTSLLERVRTALYLTLAAAQQQVD